MHQQLLAMQTQTATSMQAQTLASTDFSRPNMEMEMRRELQTFQQQVSSPATLPPPPSAKTKIQEEEEIKGVRGEGQQLPLVFLRALCRLTAVVFLYSNGFFQLLDALQSQQPLQRRRSPNVS